MVAAPSEPGQYALVPEPHVRVLYIAGTGRSGSTLFANILGQLDSCASVGELRYFWERGMLDNWYCGCGRRFEDCPMWNKVVAEAFGGSAGVDAAAVRRHLHRATRVRSLPRLALAAGTGRLSSSPAASGELGRHLDRLYRGVAAASGCEVIVDSSKLPIYAWLLERLAGLDVCVVHLVRDPRGAAYSWRRRSKPRVDATETDTTEVFSPAKSALLWTLWNGLAAAIYGRSSNYLRVRYEDFAREPEATVDQVARFARLDRSDLPFHSDHVVELQPSHTVSGNPNRLGGGKVDIAADDEWSGRMARSEQALVTALTLPVLARFGYPVVPRPSTGRADHHGGLTVQELPPLRRFARRAGRHWQWARDEGVGRLFEEGDLHPVTRARRAVAKHRWRANNQGGPAIPVFVVGVQRSGTNMVVGGLAMCPAVDLCNESDGRAFHRFQLRDDDTVRRLVDGSPYRYLVLKPLCDSHRLDHLLDDLGTAEPGRAIWMYRGVDDRVRSAVAKFGDANLRVLQDFVAGRGTDRWQVQRLSEESRELLASLDMASLSAESGAALLWYVRNSLYFELGLHQRSDVTLVSYEGLVADPEGCMRDVCAFLGLDYTLALVGHIRPRRVTTLPVGIDPLVRRHCDDLQRRLDGALPAKPLKVAGRE
jgi:hypothetical protein